MLGAPAFDDIRPKIADPYLVAFHQNTVEGIRNHGIKAPATVELAKATSAVEDAIVIFSLYLNK